MYATIIHKLYSKKNVKLKNEVYKKKAYTLYIELKKKRMRYIDAH